MNPASGKLYPGLVQSFGIIITFLILSICVDLLMTVLTGANHTAPVPYTAGIGLATALTLVFAWFLSEAPVVEAFPRRDFPLFVLVPLFLLISGIAVFLTQVTDSVQRLIPIPPNIEEQLRTLSSHPAFAVYAILIGPALEEMLMRGIVLRGLLSRYSVPFAIFADAGLFAVMHFNPWQFIPAFTLGLLNAWLFVRRRSIFLCIVTHVMWNGFFFVQGTISGDEPASIPLAVNVAALCLVAGGMRQLRKYV